MTGPALAVRARAAAQSGMIASRVGSERPGGDLVDEPDELDAEVVVDRESRAGRSPRPGRRGRARARRSTTRGASSLIARTSNRTTSWLENPSVSFSSTQNGCDSLTDEGGREPDAVGLDLDRLLGRRSRPGGAGREAIGLLAARLELDPGPLDGADLGVALAPAPVGLSAGVGGRDQADGRSSPGPAAARRRRPDRVGHVVAGRDP